MGRYRKWKGISVLGSESTEDIVMRREMQGGVPYILYQPVVAVLVLVLDCFHIAFQSGVKLHTSKGMRAFPCQERPLEIPKLVLRIYQRM